MYAIVDIAGQQFKVEKNQKIFVHRLKEKEGSKVDFDRVLLIDTDKKVLVGEPVIEGAVISGKVLSHLRGDKIRVFKKKRRKGYSVLNGHRQYLTEVLIEDIRETAGARKAAAKPTAKSDAGKTGIAKAEAKVKGEKKVTAGTKTTAPRKTVAKQKPTAEKKAAAEKKPAAGKKPAAKKSTNAGTTAKKTDTGKPAADKDSK